jgi:cytoskeletal protein RodZ
MKKSLASLLLALSLMLVLCAGCGSDNTATASVSATMAPTDTPAPTEEPVEETEEPVEETAAPEEEEEAQEPEEEAEEQPTATTAPAATTTTTTTTAAATEAPAESAQDNKSTAEGMVGNSVDALYAAVGSPNGSEYTASCLVMDGEDGILYYGDFTVSTVRYADGSEYVVGVY